ncbi:iron chelate uptake ABC transporter family permease subunit [Acetobacterium paludosum]|uniref:Iron chelate uptake ABC transporter family permease subunit n=1 Tax=Acetobacterium paludosum TaxID=52693 RepID=A0A923HYZ4_9FIRM|nr:iron ABC transporter permease [Acetobacterium paludosum]MBC3889194.1 iron chelate uptake ABC transporter family permease subunit [Acetobacterium paludosum]
MADEQKKKPAVIVIIVSSFLLILFFFISLMLGRYQVTLGDIATVFYSKIFQTDCNVSEMVQSVILKVRIPRICAAILIGGALATAGATYQGLFKNPMISPDILGASAGAGFGAAMAILLSLPFVFIQFSAFLFGLLAVGLACLICKMVSRGKDALLILVLAGMIVGTFFSSLITLMKYVADPQSKLPEITYWLMGGLSAVSSSDVLMMLVPFFCGIVPLFLLRWQLNAMAFGDEEARAMGLNTKKLRTIYIVSATLLTAAAVAVCGMIGWIGLIIPHLTRMLVGPNHKYLIPASFLIGGVFLLMVDDLARTLFTMEIPLGILTSIIGAPFFVYLLLKRKKGWI